MSITFGVDIGKPIKYDYCKDVNVLPVFHTKG